MSTRAERRRARAKLQKSFVSPRVDFIVIDDPLIEGRTPEQRAEQRRWLEANLPPPFGTAEEDADVKVVRYVEPSPLALPSRSQLVVEGHERLELALEEQLKFTNLRETESELRKRAERVRTVVTGMSIGRIFHFVDLASPRPLSSPTATGPDCVILGLEETLAEEKVKKVILDSLRAEPEKLDFPTPCPTPRNRKERRAAKSGRKWKGNSVG